MAKGFDNAYTKMVKALERLNEQFANEFQSEYEGAVVEIFPDGSGAVKIANNSVITLVTTLYEFSGYDDLMTYLEAGQLKRTVMSMSVEK